MMKKLFALVCSISLALLGGSAPSPLQKQGLQDELDALTRRGMTYRILENGMVEITEISTGAKRLKSLNEPSEAEIRAWAAKRGIPIMEIDPATIDTSLYAGWFKYWCTVPLSNTEGVPLVVGDVDGNGKPEVYGIYWDSSSAPRSRVYEVTTNGVATPVYEFIPRMGSATQLTDIDKDSLLEVNYQFGDSAYNFEQPTSSSLPVHRQFVHAEYEYFGTAIKTREFIGDLDGDSLTDFLYRGSVVDTNGDPDVKTFVAEYDPVITNFRKVWSTHLWRRNDSPIGGYEVGDFDADGRKDFIASGLWGHVWVVENNGDNSYGVVWQDSIPFTNAFYQGSGDVDNDGRPEFFIGATSDGDWTVMFEADSDNHYSAKLIIHLLSGGTFDNPQYLSTDVDGDGKLELVVCAGADIYIFKTNHDNSYYLWYLKRENAREGILFYDFNQDGKKDFIISKIIYVDPPGYLRDYADIYVATGIASANANVEMQIPQKLELYMNYPNPFNPVTNFKFFLPTRIAAQLTIYDVLGKEVQIVLNKTMDAGVHTAQWNAKGKSSGIYICCLKAGKELVSKKIVLIQ